MAELLVVAVGAFECAVRADRVARLLPIPSVSRPMRRQRPDVVAVAEGAVVRYFSDLGVRLGVAEPITGRGTGVILSETDSISGFAVASAPESIVVPDEAILSLDPAHGATPVEGCARVDGRLVPILGEVLLSSLAEPVLARWSVAAPEGTAGASRVSGQLTEVVVADRRLAVPGSDLETTRSDPAEIVRVPCSSAHVPGITPHAGALHPIVDLAALLDLGTSGLSAVLFARLVGDALVLFRVDEVRGALPPDAPLTELPPMLGRPGVRVAALVGEAIVPVVDLGRALASTPEPALAWDLASDFPDRFLAGEVEVHEFSVAGVIYSVPEAELAVLDTDPGIVPFPSRSALVCGAARLGDRIAPVIDLHAFLGRSAPSRQAEPMLLVRNGAFEAIFVPERDLGTRVIDVSAQRALPLATERPFVYGCYVDGADVRLILNVGLIAQHAHDPATQQLLAGLAGTSDADSTAEPAGRTGGATPSVRSDDHQLTQSERVGHVPTDASPTEAPEQTPVQPPDQTPNQTTFSEVTAIPDRRSVAREEVPEAPRDDASRADTADDTAVSAGSDAVGESAVPRTEAHPGQADPGAERTDANEPAALALPDEPRHERRRRRPLLLLLLLLLLIVAAAVLVPRAIRPRASAGGVADATATNAESSARSQAPAGAGSQPEPDAAADERRTASSRVYFEPDSGELTPQARSAIDAFVTTLASDQTWSIDLVGHTARVGSEASSLALSELRARTAAAYLVARMGFEPDSMAVRGAGASEPIASNRTASGRALNRRVEIIATSAER